MLQSLDMNDNKKLVIGVLILVVIGVGYYLVAGKNKNQQEVTIQNEASSSMSEGDEDGNVVTYKDPTTKESVTIAFLPDGQSATLNGLGYNAISLTVATSGSGARYVNEGEGLEVWNRGDDVTISRAEKEIFVGNVGGMTTAEKLTASPWVWEATTIADAVVEPKIKGAFVITFDSKTGQINATTDCNNVFGPYTVEGDKLKFGALGMTKKFCEGSQDDIFAAQLNEVSSFYFTGSGALVLQFGKSSDHMLFGKQ